MAILIIQVETEVKTEVVIYIYQKIITSNLDVYALTYLQNWPSYGYVGFSSSLISSSL